MKTKMRDPNLPELRECEHVRGKIVGLAGVAFEMAVHSPPASPVLFRCCSLTGCVLDLVGVVWAVCPAAAREHKTIVVQSLAADLRARLAAPADGGES